MKKIEVRKTGDVRLTGHANPLYIIIAASGHAGPNLGICG
jgi:hypothetical protein